MDIRVKGFRIQNYKVIHDSGYCSVNEKITTLIGKHESGKTIILEALKKFNTDTNIEEDHQTRKEHHFQTIITVFFQIPNQLLNQLFEQIGLTEQFFHSETVEVRKYSPGIYRLNPTQKQELVFPKDDDIELHFLNLLLPLLPHFSFLESRDNTFPPKMNLETANQHPWYTPLKNISDFSETPHSNTSFLKTTFPTLKDLKPTSLKKINVKVVPECQNFFDPILYHLFFIRKGNLIAFVINDGHAIYELDKLNRLQRWYLSFYIKAGYTLTTETNPIFLIDEPGILIHSHSQIRLLSKLESFSTNHQTIFTTHSPYLIDSEKIYRIRLVEKTIDGTRTVEKIHAVTDSETLNPILTAIGINATPINNIQRKRNVIVEGASDLYYMEAFKQLLGEESIHFIFGGGAGNMAKVGTILRGWGCDILYLYDNDKGGMDAEKNLKKYWLFGEKDVIYVMDIKGTIEDILHPDDFRRIILETQTFYPESNSGYIRKTHLNKVACALKFKEYLHFTKEIQLHPQTRVNITRLFKIIEQRFEKVEAIHLKQLSHESFSSTSKETFPTNAKK